MPGIANHIKKFWDPRMRNAIFAYMDAGGEGIDPPVRKALDHLQAEAGQKGKSSLGERWSNRGPDRERFAASLQTVAPQSVFEARGFKVLLNC